MSRVFRRDDSWWIDFQDADGIRRRQKIGPVKRVAQEVLNDVLAKVTRQERLGVVTESSIPFAEFAKEWLSSLRSDLKPRTIERRRGIVTGHLVPYFRGALKAIKSDSAEAYIAQRVAAGAAPSTVNREMTVLKQLMRRAVSRRYLARNPFRDDQGTLADSLRPLKEPPGRTRYLALEEIEALLAASDKQPYLRAFILIALNTGMRRNEILHLTRQAFDPKNRTAKITETKNGEVRHVHLNDAAFAALESLPRRIDGRLFPLATPNQMSVQFARACRRAGIADCRLHDLRHTFASYQAMNGVQGRGLQAMLGHKDPRMTQRYSHLSDAYLRTAVNAVNLGIPKFQ
jgi:integrase